MRVLHAPKSHVVPSGNGQAAPSSGAAAGQPDAGDVPPLPPSDGAVPAKSGPSEVLELPHAVTTAHAPKRTAEARATSDASAADAIGEAPDEVSIQRRIEL